MPASRARVQSVFCLARQIGPTRFGCMWRGLFSTRLAIFCVTVGSPPTASCTIVLFMLTVGGVACYDSLQCGSAESVLSLSSSFYNTTIQHQYSHGEVGKMHRYWFACGASLLNRYFVSPAHDERVSHVAAKITAYGSVLPCTYILFCFFANPVGEVCLQHSAVAFSKKETQSGLNNRAWHAKCVGT